MQAHLFLPALLLVLGGAAAAPVEAQELGLRYRGEHAQVRLSAGSHGLGASLTLGAFRGQRGYERGYGRRDRVRGVRIDHRDRRHVCVTRSVWVPGHHETRERRVFVPGRREKVWIDPVYVDGFDSCGQPIRRLVRDGYWDVVQHPGHYETRRQAVWVPGRRERRTCCSH